MHNRNLNAMHCINICTWPECIDVITKDILKLKQTRKVDWRHNERQWINQKRREENWKEWEGNVVYVKLVVRLTRTHKNSKQHLHAFSTSEAYEHTNVLCLLLFIDCRGIKFNWYCGVYTITINPIISRRTQNA